MCGQSLVVANMVGKELFAAVITEKPEKEFKQPAEYNLPAKKDITQVSESWGNSGE